MDTSKKSHEAPMTFNVVSWKGVSMPEVKEPIGVLRLIATSKRKVSSQILRDICFTLGNRFSRVTAGTTGN